MKQQIEALAAAGPNLIKVPAADSAVATEAAAGTGPATGGLQLVVVWLDGCAGHFKGTPAVLLHWQLAVELQLPRPLP